MHELFTLNNLKKPKRLLSHISLKLAYYFRFNHVPLLPTNLDIEPNNWCNFKCDHCQVTHWDKPKSELSIDNFVHITKQFPNLVLVKIQGMGEPFLNKSTIDMFENLDKQGIATTTTSNGSVLTNKLINRLSKLKHTSVSFSMDGATKSTFEGIRIKGNFDKVTANIKKLSTHCSNLNLNFWIVVTNKNYQECEGIVDVAKKTGIPKITFQTYLTSWGKDEMDEKNKAKLAKPADIKTHIDKAISKGQTVDIQVNKFEGDDMTLDQPCQWPWRSMYIDASGNVVPCCVLGDSNTMSFGNILEKDAKTIWNSQHYKDFRKMHSTGNIPEVCKACYKMEQSNEQTINFIDSKQPSNLPITV